MAALKKEKIIPTKAGTKKQVKKLVKKTTKKVATVPLQRSENNPIIEPIMDRPWESKATFNPTAMEHEGKIHIIYRAVGDNDSSVLGYAASSDGVNIIDRSPYPVYQRTNNFDRPDFSFSPIDYISGGGWNGGCEDPRLTLLGDTAYMLYTAFDGWGSVRIALTSIRLDDLLALRWNWKKPVMISPPGEIHKNWVLFPEKINGKFAILHSFYPEILIDYFDSLDELDGKTFIKSNNTRPVDENRIWDSWFRGVGPAPIKTDIGWLVLYHAMNHRNPDRYRLGALILDLKNPTQILYRSEVPILEPEESYENNGYKWGVIYSCGAVIKPDQRGDDTLFVYYGGADKVIGVASIQLDRLLQDLKGHQKVKLKKQVPKI
jgi:beta-1,2-mannobiose phosphorylase / 1,2-beta-oligomannan phosphorylase